jgi:hypothetical protein
MLQQQPKGSVTPGRAIPIRQADHLRRTLDVLPGAGEGVHNMKRREPKGAASIAHRSAPPLGAAHITLCRSFQVAISDGERQPTLWEPGMTRSGPLAAWLSSKCNRRANIPAITEAGGYTCCTPALIDHGPKWVTSFRSRTAIVRSWCQTAFQLESC